MMLTVIVVALVALTVIAVVVWWFLDFEMPEVVIPVAAPGIGAGIIYWYGTPIAWAVGLAIILAAALFVFYVERRAKARRFDTPK